MLDVSFRSWSATDLLELSARARLQARRFAHHPAGESLRDLADELSDRAETTIWQNTETSAAQQ
jgi:hypothetical protein